MIKIWKKHNSEIFILMQTRHTCSSPKADSEFGLGPAFPSGKRSRKTKNWVVEMKWSSDFFRFPQQKLRFVCVQVCYFLFLCTHRNPNCPKGLQTKEIRNQLQVLDRILSTSFRDQDLFSTLRVGNWTLQWKGEGTCFFARVYRYSKYLEDETRYTNRKFHSNFAPEKCWERETIYFPFGEGYGDDSETLSSL